MGFLFDPAFRLAAGLVFFSLFSWLFYRFSRGSGKPIFFVLSLLLIALFWILPFLLIVAFLGLGVLLVWDGSRRRSNHPGYLPARALVEGGGIKRGLTPPEAAILLEMPLSRILTVVLTGLLKKGVLELAPVSYLSLQVAGDYRVRGSSLDAQGRNAQRRMAAQKHNVVIHPFEEPFLELLEENEGQPLPKLNFTAPLRALLRHTARRMGGYDLAETREYYRKHLGRARHDVALASARMNAQFASGEDSLVSGQNATDANRLLEHHLEWVVLDETLRDYYLGFQPHWLPWRTIGFPEWAARLERELAQSISEGGFFITTGNTRLTLDGDDPVSEEIFKAVYQQVWPD